MRHWCINSQADQWNGHKVKKKTQVLMEFSILYNKRSITTGIKMNFLINGDATGNWGKKGP